MLDVLTEVTVWKVFMLVTYQIINLIGELHFLICILQSFVIILKHVQMQSVGLTTRLQCDKFVQIAAVLKQRTLQRTLH